MSQPIAYLRDAHEGEGEPCFVPAAKGDAGAFPVFTAHAPDLLEACKAALAYDRSVKSSSLQRDYDTRVAIAEKLAAAISRAEGSE
jgi:hypothetical protein